MVEVAQSTRPKPFVFVLIPFDPKFDDIYKFGIQGAATDAGAYAERVDEQIFMEGMLERIFNQISKADVVVADMTGRNPNVFYEVGYAHALDKIVLLLTQDSNDIPFDLKHRQHTVYGGKIDILRAELTKKLAWAIAESHRRTDRASVELISLQVLGRAIPAGLQPEDVVEISGSVPQNARFFALPVQLRNDAAETLRAISHVYLFTEDDASIVPGKETLMYTFGTFGEPAQARDERRVEQIDAFTANPMDAPDGLTRQYRLPITFPALPPGAIEVAHLELTFKDFGNRDLLYRLRLHTQARFYDYTFRLKISVKDMDTEASDA